MARRGGPDHRTVAPGTATAIADRDRGAAEPGDGHRRLIVLGIVIVALVGVAMRVWVLRSGAGVLDSDEGVPGLMARHLLDGHFSTFYWGQQYGGTLEVVVDAIAVFIGGSTRLALKTPPLLEAVVLTLLVWRVGRRTVGSWAGGLAALMVWIWPANYVWYSTKERVFYLPILLFGLSLLLLALRLDEEPGRRRDWLLFGFVAGIGWWTGPQIVFTAAPALLWLAWRRRTQIWPGVAFAAGAAVVGAAPWIRANVHSGLASLDTSLLDDHQGFASHLETILRKGIPSALGLRFSYTEFWLRPPIGQVLYFVAIAALVVASIRLWRTSSLIVVTAWIYPVVAAMSPSGGFVGEGRYMIFVWPLLALLFAGLVGARPPTRTGIAPRTRGRMIAAVALLGLVGVISVAGLRHLPDAVSPYAPDVRVPRDMSPLISGLDRLHVRDVFAHYWIAYRLGYETAEHVRATPVGGSRNAEILAQVRRARHSAVVFVNGSASEPTFRRGLRRLGIPYTRHRFGDFVVVVPGSAYVPEAVSQAAGSPALIP